MRTSRPVADKLGAVRQDPDLHGLLFILISRATGGHWSGRAGVAFYEGWRRHGSTWSQQVSVSPDTDWVVMCGTNAGSRLMLVNGADVGSATGGSGGGVWLFVNSWESRQRGVELRDRRGGRVAAWPDGRGDARRLGVPHRPHGPAIGFSCGMFP